MSARCGGSDLAVAARQAAVPGPQAALLVLCRALALLAARLPQRLVGALENGRQQPPAKARPGVGRGSVAMLFGVHMFDTSFGGVR